MVKNGFLIISLKFSPSFPYRFFSKGFSLTCVKVAVISVSAIVRFFT